MNAIIFKNARTDKRLRPLETGIEREFPENVFRERVSSVSSYIIRNPLSCFPSHSGRGSKGSVLLKLRFGRDLKSGSPRSLHRAAKVFPADVRPWKRVIPRDSRELISEKYHSLHQCIHAEKEREREGDVFKKGSHWNFVPRYLVKAFPNVCQSKTL